MKKLIYPILSCSVFILDLVYWLLLRSNPLEVRNYYIHFFGVMIIFCCGLTTYGVLKKEVTWPVLAPLRSGLAIFPGHFLVFLYLCPISDNPGNWVVLFALLDKEGKVD